jgi:hypothetical protein
MKYIKTYENYKINEEVPFNYDANFNNIIDDAGEEWTEKEKETLEKLGADEISKSTAVFLETSYKNEIQTIDLYKKGKSSYKIETDFILTYKGKEYKDIYNFTDFTDMIQFLIEFFKDYKAYNDILKVPEKQSPEKKSQPKYHIGNNPVRNEYVKDLWALAGVNANGDELRIPFDYEIPWNKRREFEKIKKEWDSDSRQEQWW